MSEDPRFAKFKSDPKFRTVPKKKNKVKIDPRFQEIFTNKEFFSSDSIDVRGRPSTKKESNELKKYYRLDDSDSDEVESSSKKKIPTDLDYIRGEVLMSDSSSEEEESEVESDEESGFDKWGELDGDAERLKDNSEATNRLALCNMDWDRINARDIYVALSSFCPTDGNLRSVKIYLSDFGKGRLEEDDISGPKELRSDFKELQSDDEEEDHLTNLTQKEIDKIAMEKVRKYQINRLKYYYAIVNFDSIESAEKVYEECDGMEFEMSACRFDLRFVPEDETFEERSPTDVCNSLPVNYRPKSFVTTALQQGKVELTWDETDPRRKAAMLKAFDDDGEEDIKEFISPPSDDDDERLDDELEDDEENALKKYKALLTGNDSDEEGKEANEEEIEGNMEMTWSINKNLEKDLNEKDLSKLTPWEQYLKKKREKRKNKKNAKLNNLPTEEELPESGDIFDDPFFNQDPSDDKESLNKKKKKKKKNTSSQEIESNPELELMVMDSDDDKEHFDYKDIVKRESKSSKKKSKVKDNFEIDVNDSRFSAIFEDPQFNVDPSHPNFKKTVSMNKIISEKQKRILTKDPDDLPASSIKKSKVSEIDSLVKSIKMKSRQKKNK